MANAENSKDRAAKVLYVIESLDRGGAEQALLNLIPELVAQGVRPLVLPIKSGGALRSEYEAFGAEVIDQDFGRKWNLLKNIRLLKGLVQSHKPEVIHAHLFFAGLYVGMLKYLGIKQPKLITFHNLAYAPGCNPRNPGFYLRKLLNRHVVKHCMDGRIAVSSAVAEHYAKNLGLALDCFDVIPNGLPIPEANTDSAVDKPDGKIKIVALGRLVPEKGYDYLLRAFAQLCERQPERFQLQVIGGGPLNSELLVQASDLGIDVSFLGSMAYADAQTALSGGDIYVTASVFEGFGLSVAEAMLAGIPVVATDVGGIRDIVRASFSEIVSPRNLDALADAVLRVAELPEAERNRRVKEAREFVEQHFSVDSVATRLADLYQRQLKLKEIL